MSTSKRPKSVSEVLRKAIEDSDDTRYRIAQETGISEPTLSRFMSRKRGLSMEAIDALATYLGLELTPRKGRRPS